MNNWLAALEAARKNHPDDLSVAIAEALVALGSGDAERIEPALDRLDELVEKTPLEPLPEGRHAPMRGSGLRPPARSPSGWSPAPAGSRKTRSSWRASPTSWPRAPWRPLDVRPRTTH